MKLRDFVGRLNPFYVIYCVVALVGVALMVYLVRGKGGIWVHYDTDSYINSMKSLISGEPGCCRPPLYPALIAFVLKFGLAGDILLMVIQWAVFVVAVHCFRLTLGRFVGSKKICVVTTAVFGLAPCVVIFNCVELAESLSISCIVFLLYWVCGFVRRPTVKSGAVCAIFVFVLIFLRPVFIYLLPVMAVFYVWLIFRGKAFRRGASAAIAGLCIVAGAVCGYMEWMRSAYGLRMLTYANLINDYFFARDSGVLVVDEVKDPEIKSMLICWGDWTPYNWRAVDECNVFAKSVGMKAVRDEIDDAIARHPDRALKALARRTVEFATYQLEPLYCGGQMDRLASVMPVRLWIVYVALLGGCFVAFWYRRRLSRDRYSFVVCIAVVLANLCVVLVGAMADWGRLMAPVYSCVLLLLAVSADRLREAFGYGKLNKSVGNED